MLGERIFSSAQPFPLKLQRIRLKVLPLVYYVHARALHMLCVCLAWRSGSVDIRNSESDPPLEGGITGRDHRAGHSDPDIKGVGQ